MLPKWTPSQETSGELKVESRPIPQPQDARNKTNARASQYRGCEFQHKLITQQPEINFGGHGTIRLPASYFRLIRVWTPKGAATGRQGLRKDLGAECSTSVNRRYEINHVKCPLIGSGTQQ